MDPVYKTDEVVLCNNDCLEVMSTFPATKHLTKTSEREVRILCFQDNYYSLWQFVFQNPNDYNSIILSKSQCYEIE